ncbi:MAG: LamG domain-containing protein, partial [Candidatus Moraniibacteriota bacterium]
MSPTGHRTIQYIGLLLALAALAAGYWYFSVRASTKLQSSQAGSLTNGLVGYWSLDGQDVKWEDNTTEVKDSSGFGNDADALNMSVTAVTPGRIGQAMNFDGVNQSVNMGTGAAFDNLNTKTVSAWIKPSGLTAYRGIMGRGTWAFQICSNDATDCNGTTGRIVYYHEFSGTEGKWILGANSVTANQWAHVVVTYDRTSTANDPVIYVNGVSQSVTELSAPTGTANDETGTSLQIGYDGYAYAMGAIDDVRIYNR